MRILPREQRDAMYAVYAFCRAVDDVADDRVGSRSERRAELDRWRADIAALYAGNAPARVADLAEPVRRFELDQADFLAIIDGMQMDVDEDIRAPDLAKLDLYCDRVASAVGRLSVRIFGVPRELGPKLAHHLGRALQLTNILRDLDEDAEIGRLYLPREKLAAAGITSNRSAYGSRVAGSRVGLRFCCRRSRAAFCRSQRHHRQSTARDDDRAAADARRVSPHSGETEGARLERAARACAHAQRPRHSCRAKGAPLLMQPGTVHVIGAGIAGLAAAVRLAERGRHVVVHEQARQAGGRCRSYFDAAVGLMIDNGNHLVLSGNHAVLAFLQTIGSEHGLEGPRQAEFFFIDLKSKERWTLRPNEGAFPWWILSRAHRVPGSKARDYLRLLPLLWAGPDARIGDTISCRGVLYERLWRPFLLAALNIEPGEASARLAGAVVRETLAKGGDACRPLIATEGLSSAFIEPARSFIEEHGGGVLLDRRLRALTREADRVTSLDFGEEQIALGPNDFVVLAVPARVAEMLLPEISAPSQFNAIVNAHFRVAPPPGTPLLQGVVNGLVEWLFAFPDRLSVTISGADRLIDAPRDALARDVWVEVAEITGLPAHIPPWQIVKERRATFSATPEQDSKRPAAATDWANLVLAGDWTQTGLPATLEGAVRSGNEAAALIIARKGAAAAPGPK